MPVTARLSKRFYDAIGDDAANDLVNWMNAVDLTYRNELLQHNEANFTRFVTLLDSRIAELRSEMDRRFDQVDRRFDNIEQRLEKSEQRLAAVEAGLVSLEARIDAKFDKFESKMLRWMLVFWTTTMLGVGGIVFAALQAR
jgi:hypothetical protein